jgi:hypothetical protein
MSLDMAGVVWLSRIAAADQRERRLRAAISAPLVDIPIHLDECSAKTATQDDAESRKKQLVTA